MTGVQTCALPISPAFSISLCLPGSPLISLLPRHPPAAPLQSQELNAAAPAQQEHAFQGGPGNVNTLQARPVGWDSRPRGGTGRGQVNAASTGLRGLSEEVTVTGTPGEQQGWAPE